MMPRKKVSITAQDLRATNRKLFTENTASGSESESHDILWRIKDIIDEDQDRYLFDWEDHPETGEVFEPTWVRKACACCRTMLGRNMIVIDRWHRACWG